MAIEKYKPESGGLLSSPLLKVGLGALTGGLGGAALGLVAAKAPGLSTAIGAGSALSKALGPSDSPQTDANFKMPELGSSSGIGSSSGGQDYNPMSSRMSMMDQDPKSVLGHGLNMLDHPDVPGDVKALAAPYLLGAAHYGGPHPNIDYHLRRLGHISDDGGDSA